MTDWYIEWPAFPKPESGYMARGDNPEDDAHRAYRLLLDCIPRPPARYSWTPERAGWVAIWCPLVSTTRAIAALEEAHDKLALVALSRTTLELELYATAITSTFDGLSSGVTSGGIRIKGDLDSLQKDERRRRLAGFGTLCIMNDLAALKSQLGLRAMNELYDNSAIAALVKDPKALAVHEAVFGPLEISNQHEHDLERERHAADVASRIARLEEFLKHPAASGWVSHIREVEAQKRHLPDFLDLIIEGGRARQLRDAEITFLNSLYKSHSSALHGCTFEHWVSQLPGTPPAMIPAPASTDQLPSSAFESIVKRCRSIGMRLFVIKDEVW